MRRLAPDPRLAALKNALFFLVDVDRSVYRLKVKLCAARTYFALEMLRVALLLAAQSKIVVYSTVCSRRLDFRVRRVGQRERDASICRFQTHAFGLLPQ